MLSTICMPTADTGSPAHETGTKPCAEEMGNAALLLWQSSRFEHRHHRAELLPTPCTILQVGFLGAPPEQPHPPPTSSDLGKHPLKLVGGVGCSCWWPCPGFSGSGFGGTCRWWCLATDHLTIRRFTTGVCKISKNAQKCLCMGNWAHAQKFFKRK